MNSASLIYAQSSYFFLPADVEQVNLIAAAGVACVLSGNLIYEKLFVPARASGFARRAPRAPGEALRKGVPLLLIGAGINYFILMPSSMGLIDFVVPGFISSLAMCEHVGFALLAIWAFARSTHRGVRRRGRGRRRELGRPAHAQQELGALALDRLRDRRAQLQPYHRQAGYRRSIDFFRLRHSPAPGGLRQKRGV